MLARFPIRRTHNVTRTLVRSRSKGRAVIISSANIPVRRLASPTALVSLLLNSRSVVVHSFPPPDSTSPLRLLIKADIKGIKCGVIVAPAKRLGLVATFFHLSFLCPTTMKFIKLLPFLRFVKSPLSFDFYASFLPC